MSNVKSADLSETLQRMGGNLSTGLSGASDKIRDWYTNLDPEARGAMLRGLIGAAVGGTLTGGMALATPRDPEERRFKSVVNPALLGAVLGGAGAAGFPVAEKMFGGQIRLSGEHKRPAMTGLTDALLGVPIHNPLLTAGTIGGTAMASRLTLPHFMEARRGLPKPTVNPAEHIKNVLTAAIKNRDIKSVRNIVDPAKALFNQRTGRIVDAWRAGRGIAESAATAPIVKDLGRLNDPSILEAAKIVPKALARRNYRLGAAALIGAPILGYLGDKYVRGDY